MLSNHSAAAAALATCFGQEGDCSVVVVADCYQASEASEPPAKRRANADFRVWSRILAAWSDVFRAMFSHECLERSQGKVEIKGFSAAAVEKLLRFLYSGNLEVGSDLLVIEVDGLADKYNVQPLRDICCAGIRQKLGPSTACEMLEEAIRVSNAKVQETCLNVIYKDPRNALQRGFILSSKCLTEVLGSTMLCASDFDLAAVLLSWPADISKTGEHNVPSLLEQHVQLAGVSEEQYGRLCIMAENAAAGCADALARMWQKFNRGKHTSDFFSTMWASYVEKFPNDQNRPPFLGYWINLTPSNPGFGQTSTVHHSHMADLVKIARNGDCMRLSTSEEMTWVQRIVLWLLALKMLCLELLFDSGVVTDANAAVVEIRCRSRQCARWFRLTVRDGNYKNKLRIQGILQSK
jgi:hypothetical protein